MAASLPQVSWDDRPAVMRLRRTQLYEVLTKRNISFPVGAAKTQMLKLLEANGVDLTQPLPEVDWIEVVDRDENGQMHREFYPKEMLHESARDQQAGKIVDYEAEIAKRAAEAEAAAEVVETQSDMLQAQSDMLKSMQSRLAELEANQLPLDKMAPYQLKQIAEQRGISVDGLKSKDELLAALGA